MLRVRNLNVSVPEIEILRNVSMTARRGELTAIMGPSGAGKTTLLDYVAGRPLQAKVRGSLEVDGKTVSRRRRRAFRRTVAYVEQHECLISTATVRETFLFAARLQLPNGTPAEEVEARVDKVTRDLGLEERKDMMVGDENIRGLSGGEKRRVSIGQQLVKDPELLIMDEPTSGLDSHIAYSLLVLLKRLAKQENRMIITTLHQPNSKITKLFDIVHLMADGRAVFSGPVSAALSFFAEHKEPCPPMYNPSDHFLDVISDKKRAAALADAYRPHEPRLRDAKRSATSDALAGEAKSDASIHTNPSAGASSSLLLGRNTADRQRASFWTQCSALTERKAKQWLRDPVMLMSELFQYAVIALFLASLYHPLKDDVTDGPFERYSALFFLITCICFTPSFTVMTKFDVERVVLRRETGSGMYSMSAYFTSVTLTTTIVEVLMALLFAIIEYWFVGFRPQAIYFAQHFLILAVFVVISESIGLCVAALTPNATVGIVAITLPLIIFMSVSGFLTTSTPIYYDWLRWINFFSYAMIALVDVELGQGATLQLDGQSVRASDYIRGNLKNGLGFNGNLGVLFGMAVLYRGLAWVCLQRVRDTVQEDGSGEQDDATDPDAADNDSDASSQGSVGNRTAGPKPRALEMTVVVEGKEAQEGKETQDEADTNNIASF